MGLEEIKARQRSRDRNTTYFQDVANQRSRRKLVTILEGPNGLVDTQEGMMKVARDFYKELFAKESKEDITIGEPFQDEENFISQEENDMLTAPFTEEAIRGAIFSCYDGLQV
jgi:vacuolar-type H+-ATPase subunit B/Vma2